MSDTPRTYAVEKNFGEMPGEMRKLERELRDAQADAAVMREALTKERAAIARFLVPWRSRLDQSWLDNFVESGSVRFDAIGYVFPVDVATNAGRELLAEVEELRGKLRALENVSVSPMENPDLDWIDAMRADKAAAVQGLNSTLLAQLEAKSELVKLFREEMFLKNSELQSAQAEMERLRKAADSANVWHSRAEAHRQAKEALEVEITTLRRKVAASKDMAESLESCKANVEHEIRRRKLLKQSTDQWPDVLTGCVSGGGIEAALAKWQEVNK